jgi:putative modified peptide
MADFKLTTEQADALLDKLANDAAYRDLFQKDVAAAFALLPGAPLPPPDLEPGCCLEPEKLASPEQILATRDALRKSLTSLVEYKPHLLEG